MKMKIKLPKCIRYHIQSITLLVLTIVGTTLVYAEIKTALWVLIILGIIGTALSYWLEKGIIDNCM